MLKAKREEVKRMMAEVEAKRKEREAEAARDEPVKPSNYSAERSGHSHREHDAGESRSKDGLSGIVDGDLSGWEAGRIVCGHTRSRSHSREPDRRDRRGESRCYERDRDRDRRDRRDRDRDRDENRGRDRGRDHRDRDRDRDRDRRDRRREHR